MTSSKADKSYRRSAQSAYIRAPVAAAFNLASAPESAVAGRTNLLAAARDPSIIFGRMSGIVESGRESRSQGA
jgi:hypothetical protein